jgi:predicted naringenin-chalcone synthase
MEAPEVPDDALAAPLVRARRRALLWGVGLVAAGAALGVAYHYAVGCPTGACALVATPWRSAAYGAVLGLLVAAVWRR